MRRKENGTEFMAPMADTPEMAAERENFVALDLMRCGGCGKGVFMKRGEAFQCVCGATAYTLPLEGGRAE